MVDGEPGTGGPPVYGWRRSARPPRSVLSAHLPADLDQNAQGQPPNGVQPPTDQLPACPWLYMHTDPDARAAFVTADHRCEIRPDEVPGPGHQLAYCLTPNHVSCPQLRRYEADRRAGAQPQSGRQALPMPTVEPAHAPARTLSTPRVNGMRALASHPGRARAFSRIAWAGAGILGTLAFVVGLTVLASPDETSSATEPTSQAQPTAPAAEATSASFAGPENLEATVVVGAGPTATATGSAALAAPAAEASPKPTPRSTPAPTAEPVPPRIYIVQRGDTLTRIARDLGTTVTALLEANEIGEGTVIAVGAKLLIPTEPVSP